MGGPQAVNTINENSDAGRFVVAGVTKSFGLNAVLIGVDLAVVAGESLAITGRSGSGKSTLLHVIAGIDVPDSGRVNYVARHRSVEISQLSDRERTNLRRRSFGFVFQRGMLLPELTTLENVALPLLLNGAHKAHALAVAARKLMSVRLGDHAMRRPGQLSGGEAQRVAIARAIATDPEVVFADEPTASLDSTTADIVVDELFGATTGQGRTLILVTHDHHVAARCDRVMRLRDGAIEEMAHEP